MITSRPYSLVGRMHYLDGWIGRHQSTIARVPGSFLEEIAGRMGACRRKKSTSSISLSGGGAVHATIFNYLIHICNALVGVTKKRNTQVVD